MFLNNNKERNTIFYSLKDVSDMFVIDRKVGQIFFYVKMTNNVCGKKVSRSRSSRMSWCAIIQLEVFFLPSNNSRAFVCSRNFYHGSLFVLNLLFDHFLIFLSDNIAV